MTTPTSPAIPASGAHAAAQPARAVPEPSNPRAYQVAACYGLACAPHAQCARYHAVEQVSEGRVIDSCETQDHRRPMFVLAPAGGNP